MSIRRTMIEKTYGELAAGDCVWISGALLRVDRPHNANTGPTVSFAATVVRAGGAHDEGDSMVLTGLAHCPVLCEEWP